jgi:hypothetical protein
MIPLSAPYLQFSNYLQLWTIIDMVSFSNSLLSAAHTNFLITQHGDSIHASAKGSDGRIVTKQRRRCQMVLPFNLSIHQQQNFNVYSAKLKKEEDFTVETPVANKIMI